MDLRMAETSEIKQYTTAISNAVCGVCKARRADPESEQERYVMMIALTSVLTAITYENNLECVEKAKLLNGEILKMCGLSMLHGGENN